MYVCMYVCMYRVVTSYAICKILPITFRGSIYAWYNNLDLDFIISFGDLCSMLVTQFCTSVLAKRISTKLFGVTQTNDEFMRVYLKRFNEKIFKIKELIKLMASKTLISGVKWKALWKELYVLSNVQKPVRSKAGHIEPHTNGRGKCVVPWTFLFP